ncbi:hypothetical protein EJ03DRAFT_337414 [Teratosphaeria nubilosa]|uniref:Uncharacterized protein n=1 Tax=Teratosphaeria nubilosa TaxID=161662 RepID=A0A6G1L4A4_9PEZI|nr:hypothetical protein EJ03DRAFT_337414 [Teratosphaeria nubilosa]
MVEQWHRVQRHILQRYNVSEHDFSLLEHYSASILGERDLLWQQLLPEQFFGAAIRQRFSNKSLPKAERDWSIPRSHGSGGKRSANNFWRDIITTLIILLIVFGAAFTGMHWASDLFARQGFRRQL